MVVEKRYDRKTVYRIMEGVAKEFGIKLVFMNSKEGRGGFNYGGNSGDSIMIAPFKEGKKGDVVEGIPLDADCENPLECMLLTFFHEFAHCRLSDSVPNSIKGYSSNGTSRFQYELWITMNGISFALKRGIVFSDSTIGWMLQESKTYISTDEDAHDFVIAREVSEEGYTTAIDAWWKGK